MPATKRKPEPTDYAAQAAAQASQAVPKPGYAGATPAYRPPGDHETGSYDWWKNALIGGGGIAGGLVGPALLGGGAAASGIPPAIGGIPSGVSIGGATAAPAATGGSGGATGLLGKLFGGGGTKGMFDPTSLVLGGLSLFGGDPDYFQKKSPYTGTAAPQQSLTDVLAAIKSLSASLAASGAPQLKSAIVPEGPAPVSIDGIPFQIGGGLGRDPALRDPSVLEGSNPLANPFGGKTQATSSEPKRRPQ